jgi:hypothetical protein
MTEYVLKNPYLTKPIRDPSMFFGRGEELVEIVERCRMPAHPISTILIGGRRIGKTSLLHQIHNQLLKQPEDDSGTLIPAYVTPQGVALLDISTFFEDLISAIVLSAKRYRGLPIDLPKGLTGDPYKAFRQQLWTIFNQCVEHVESVRFVLLTDEAERLLGHAWTEDVVSNLRHLIDTSDLQAFVALVITGFREVHDYAMVEEGIGSRLGNAAYWTKLGVLTERECRDLITVPLNGQVREEVVDAVYELSGGHPFITQYLMQQAWKPSSMDIMPADIIKASRQFSDKTNVFSSWKKRFRELDIEVYQVLAQSHEPIGTNEMKKLVEGEAIEESLDFLRYTGVASEQAGRHVVSGHLFRDWFVERHRSRPQEPKKFNKLKQEPGFGGTRLLVSAVVVVLIFAVTVAVLVWAARQVPPMALAFILVIAVVSNLVSIVTVLVMNGILRQKWAMEFYNAVLGTITTLKPSLYPQVEPDSEEAKRMRDAEAEGDPGR